MKKFLLFLCALCCTLGTPFAARGADTLPPDSKTIYEGIDVSVYQGEIDFAKVKTAGKEIVYIRAAYGDEKDEKFQQNAKNAKNAGLNFGFYQFVTARTAADAEKEAQFFSDLVESTGYTCRPAGEFGNLSGLSAAEANAVATAYFAKLEELTDVKPMLYTDAYAAERLWDDELRGIYLWAADWGASAPKIHGGAWDAWTGFQYADDGQVNGIEGAVDLDQFTVNALVKTDDSGNNNGNNSGNDGKDNAARTLRYTVRRGETLIGIAKQFGVTLEALLDDNTIANPNRIYVGQILLIKVPAGQWRYTVVRGDTLYAIAQLVGSSVLVIAERNDLANPSRIRVGQRLWIPAQ